MQLTQPIRRAMQILPGRIAMIQGSRRHTWSEFGQRVASLAGALQERGLAPDGRVGVLAMNSDRYQEVFYASMWAGGMVVPINFRFSPAEIVYCLNDCGTEILIVDDNFLSMASDLQAQAPCVRHVISIGESGSAYEDMLASTAPIADAGRSGDD